MIIIYNIFKMVSTIINYFIDYKLKHYFDEETRTNLWNGTVDLNNNHN